MPWRIATESHRARGRSHQPLRAVTGDSIPFRSKQKRMRAAPISSTSSCATASEVGSFRTNTLETRNREGGNDAIWRSLTLISIACCLALPAAAKTEYKLGPCKGRPDAALYVADAEPARRRRALHHLRCRRLRRASPSGRSPPCSARRTASLTTLNTPYSLPASLAAPSFRR
jgi:hypothetical protein